MYDVFFYEAFAEEAAAIQRLLPAGITAGYTDATIQESGHEQPPSRLISIRTQSRVPQNWAESISGILTRSTGYDHLRAFSKTQVGLGYLPLYCHRAVAEQAMLMWMVLLRKLPRQVRQFHSFERDGLTGGECQGRTLAVVGVGHIGHEICRIGTALGMQVLGVDLDPRYPDVTYANISNALPVADVIICAMDYNEANRNFFSADRIQTFKRGAIFINISRGELSPTTILLAALQSGQLGGVGLDVFDQESALAISLRSGQSSNSPEVIAAKELAKQENAICTPHNAFNTEEAVERKSAHSVQQVEFFLAKGQFEWQAPVSF